MAKYIVHNISGKILELIIPAPIDSGRNSMVFNLQPTENLDILPWAGTVQACKQISSVKRFNDLNYIRIYIQE